MSATNANPTGEVGNERENNQGVDFDSSHIAEKQDLDFKSGDIERKEGKDYFVNIDQKEVHRIEQRKARKEATRARKKFLRDNEGKIKTYSIIYIVIVILAIVGVIVAAIVIKNQKAEDDEAQRIEARNLELADSAAKGVESFDVIRTQYIAEIQNADPEKAYENAKASTITLIEAADDDYERVIIIARFSSLMTYDGKIPEKTISFLDEYNKYATDDEHKFIIYSCYAQAYRELGNNEKAEEYEKLQNEIGPKNEDDMEGEEQWK